MKTLKPLSLSQENKKKMIVHRYFSTRANIKYSLFIYDQRAWILIVTINTTPLKFDLFPFTLFKQNLLWKQSH